MRLHQFRALKTTLSLFSVLPVAVAASLSLAPPAPADQADDAFVVAGAVSSFDHLCPDDAGFVVGCRDRRILPGA